MNDLSLPSSAETGDPLAASPAARESSAANSVSRAHYVYNRLRDDIFELRLLPGDRLTEGTIADRFSVSRTPAREALQRLQGDGLMQGYVRGGWEVVPIDFKRFDDLYEMRELIETFAIRKLCRRTGPLKPEVIRMLDRLDAVWQVSADQRLDDGREVAELDEAFHQALIAAADNDELSAALQRVTDRIRIVRRLDFVYGDCIGTTYAEHAAILSAIRDANYDDALDCLTRHIRGSQAEVQKLTLHRLYSARTNDERAIQFDAPSRG